MLRIILAALIIWVASGEGRYILQNLTILVKKCRVQMHLSFTIISFFLE